VIRVGKLLLLLMTIVPLLEAYLLVVLGQAMGVWPTIALIVLTAGVGALLGKREGLKVWRQWRDSLREGRMPEEGILGGVLVLIGATLLITPGVLTDVIGISLLVPVSRRFIAKYVRRYLEKRFSDRTRYRVEFGSARVIDGVQTHFAQRAAGPKIVDTDGVVIEERRRGDPRGTLES
jgi:UPF0716 protein FxsA